MEQVEITKRLGEYDIVQRSSDGYINAEYLQRQLDNHYTAEINTTIQDFLECPGTKELIENLKGTPMDDNKFYEVDENSIWISPALLLPYAMQVSPELELEVIKWFYNSRIMNNL